MALHCTRTSQVTGHWKTLYKLCPYPLFRPLPTQTSSSSRTKLSKLLELAVPANSGTHHKCPDEKTIQAKLHCHLEAAGFSMVLDTLEIGSLSHFTKEAITTIQTILLTQVRRSISNLLFELSKIAVACSVHIFQARCSTDWNPNTPLIHPFTSAST